VAKNYLKAIWGSQISEGAHLSTIIVNR